QIRLHIRAAPMVFTRRPRCGREEKRREEKRREEKRREEKRREEKRREEKRSFLSAVCISTPNI
ncbi:hypothetical protein LJ420_001287, partial [Neisseria gonorrhoeae]|uniref:hypothetical protein n=2 Tax=Neisseria gonorrhoeae TaxID=485 RepID=UPI00352BA808